MSKKRVTSTENNANRSPRLNKFVFVGLLIAVGSSLTSCGEDNGNNIAGLASCDGVSIPKQRVYKITDSTVELSYYNQLDKANTEGYEGAISQNTTLPSNIQPYEFSIDIVPATSEIIDMNNLTLQWSLFNSAHACSYAPRPDIINNPIETIQVTVASTSNNDFSTNEDISDLFYISPLDNQTFYLQERQESTPLEQWNTTTPENQYYIQNYRFKLFPKDYQFLTEGSYQFEIISTLKDGQELTSQTSTIEISAYDDGASAPTYSLVYKTSQESLCHDDKNSSEEELLNELTTYDYTISLANFFDNEIPNIQFSCAISPEITPESDCEYASDILMIYEVNDEDKSVFLNQGYIAIEDLSENYIETDCFYPNDK